MNTMRLIARVAVVPWADEVAIGDHVHGLEGEAPIVAGIVQDALGAQQILAPCSCNSAPIQALNFSGSIGCSTSKLTLGDVLVVLVLIVAVQEIRARSPARGRDRRRRGRAPRRSAAPPARCGGSWRSG